MLLYIFSDALTGEIQQPILAHSDEEAIRIARMAFANVPHQILRDLYVARVNSYDPDSEPKFCMIPIYLGVDFISDIEENND